MQKTEFEFQESLISVKQIARQTGLSVITIRKLNAEGKMPKSVELCRHFRWRAKEINDWIANGCKLPSIAN